MRPNMRVKRPDRRPVKCARCGYRIPLWPQGGMIVTSESGHQEMKLCISCFDWICKNLGARVIEDNMGRG